MEISVQINDKTKISTLIKANPLVIETLVKLNPVFSKLRNPILRNMLAKRVTVSEACRMSGCKITDFFDAMASIGFKINSDLPKHKEALTSDSKEFVLPENLEIIELDVRPVLAQKQDPLKLIISKVEALQANQCLRLVNAFEPVPLINLLAKKGFYHHVEHADTETVITWFFKSGKEKAGEILPDEGIKEHDTDDFEGVLQKYQPDKLQVTDVRGLDMPLPMVTILDLLQKLPQDEALLVFHKKVPVFLLPELQQRGFSYLLKNAGDGNINMLIFKS